MKLDDVFLKDKNTRAFLKFQEFYGYKRSGGETIDSFIVKFEQLYSELAEFKMVMPSEIKACFLLMGCNISDDVEKLARATATDLTYENVKDQIKKICGMSASTQGETSAPPIKEEVLFVNKKRSNRHGSSTGNNNRYKPKTSDRKRSDHVPGERKDNPVDKRSGAKLRCFTCDSTKHFAQDCPEKPYEVHISLFNGVSDKKIMYYFTFREIRKI